MKMTSSVLAMWVWVAAGNASAGDTLVTKSGGSYKPGVAASWSESSGAVTFVIESGDAAKIATTLKERLAQASITHTGNKVTVRGIPPAALLDQLSVLSLSGDADPLAALAGLGGGVPVGEAPEGGGSIRASKPTPLAGLVMAKEHNPDERFDGEVLDAVRGAFPQVTLKLKVRRAAKAGALGKTLTSGKVLDVPVLLAGKGAAIDLDEPGNQRNIGAYYLVKGDRVLVHVIESEAGQVAVDWIERK